VLNKVRKPDQTAIKADLHRIMNARTLPAAWSAARRFADRWEQPYPKAVACLRADLAELLTCFRYPTLEQRKAFCATVVGLPGRPRGEERRCGCEPCRAA
jgi:transposase-like protein